MSGTSGDRRWHEVEYAGIHGTECQGIWPGRRPGATKMAATLKRLWQEENGQDLVEYALVASLIVLASVAALNKFAGTLTNAFTNSVANMSSTST